MNKFSYMFLFVVLFCVDCIQALSSLKGNNYQQFSKNYRGFLFTPQNTIDPMWMRGVVAALKQDRMYQEKDFLPIILGEIEPMLNYWASFPPYKDNPQFKDQVKRSVVRTFDEVIMTQQQKVNTNSSMRDAFIKFREHTLNQGLNYMFSNNSMNVTWLQEALRILSGGAPLTSASRDSIGGELLSAVEQLFRDFLNKDTSLSPGDRSKFKSIMFDKARYQIIDFMLKQNAV